MTKSLKQMSDEAKAMQGKSDRQKAAIWREVRKRRLRERTAKFLAEKGVKDGNQA